MAFDGFCINRITKEYSELFTDGRIAKIIEPNAYDLILVIKKERDTYNLFVSANPSMSYTYLVNDKGEAPLNALNFCMVLRKYIANGRILKVSQKGNERIITIEIEHLDEMGDRSVKKLIFELMGKHSNIILTDEDDIIIDSIKRVSALTSSVREVLPKKPYFVPSDIAKINPYGCDLKTEIKKIISEIDDEEKVKTKVLSLLFGKFEGVSKAFAKEVLFRADTKLNSCDKDSADKESLLLSADCSFLETNENAYLCVCDSFKELIDLSLKSNSFYSYRKNLSLCDYTTFLYESLVSECMEAEEHQDKKLVEFLPEFYASKHDESVIRQKSNDIINVLNSHIQKNNNKMNEWDKELAECENKDTLKKYGELLKAYSHSLTQGKEVEVLDYYTNENIVIPLDENKNIIANSNKYFNDYSKAKRREEKLNELLKETREETEYLEDMLLYISISENSSDLNQIRNELSEKGYLKKTGNTKEKKKRTVIKQYIYKDNYHIYVGKNNIQNEEVSFKIATGNDWWFHAKGIAGSHVIVKSDKDNGASEWDMPDEVFELCASLAALNSSHKDLTKVEVDYTRKKHLKKPAEGDKGMVIYHKYYSMVASPDISRYQLTTVNS